MNNDYGILDLYFVKIQGYEDYYINRAGQVLSTKHGKYRILKDYSTGENKNYRKVQLFKNGVREQRSVHRLVAQAFLENPDNLPCVNHKNEDPADNRVENLEWCTLKYNNNYGTRNKRIGQTLKGFKHKEVGKAVFQISENGLVNKIYPNLKATRAYGFDPHTVSKCCYITGKSYKGFYWRFGYVA
jgi:hypothetical protein